MMCFSHLDFVRVLCLIIKHCFLDKTKVFKGKIGKNVYGFSQITAFMNTWDYDIILVQGNIGKKLLQKEILY